MEKSSLFLAGVDAGIRDQLLIRTGFTIGEFPIKYLGLPLSPKKCKLMDCHALIAKITQRITVTYSKHKSYAAPVDSSWYWRKPTALKAQMHQWYSQDRYQLTKDGKYCITSSYLAIIGQRP
ncbi:hypothetical protein KY290_038072 [Solanum tuberosum]|uniref:Uncharacterized protein n=1 Tax=Solanum tuberosum TaxID=4113 RepID=A0ABQ7TZ69_SOLTU|nr:hypothetical protein KY289_005973 [Solanum tuberosum]KAH0739367.1 hypothetical protein KY290_038072 [Solanum tuberosum]